MHQFIADTQTISSDCTTTSKTNWPRGTANWSRARRGWRKYRRHWVSGGENWRVRLCRRTAAGNELEVMVLNSVCFQKLFRIAPEFLTGKYKIKIWKISRYANVIMFFFAYWNAADILNLLEGLEDTSRYLHGTFETFVIMRKASLKNDERFNS